MKKYSSKSVIIQELADMTWCLRLVNKIRYGKDTATFDHDVVVEYDSGVTPVRFLELMETARRFQSCGFVSCITIETSAEQLDLCIASSKQSIASTPEYIAMVESQLSNAQSDEDRAELQSRIKFLQENNFSSVAHLTKLQERRAKLDSRKTLELLQQTACMEGSDQFPILKEKITCLERSLQEQTNPQLETQST